MADTTPSGATATSHASDSMANQQAEYNARLQRALDQASLAFFAEHASELKDGGEARSQLVAGWCSRQQQEPHRPATVANDSNATKPKKIVRGYIDGCYDLMHSGHFNACRQARSLCDELIVGVHTNAEITKHKGPPVMADDERHEAVRACKWVDHVEFGVPYAPTIELLDRLGCDFAIHGDDDATAADGTDAFAEVKKAGRMRIVKRTEGVSTTDLVNRLLHTTQPSNRASPPASSPSPSPSPAADGAASNSVPAAISSFLPTSWRISQFSNHRVPKPTDRVVYIGGSFDLFHVGHLRKLEAAKKLGTFLYVGIYDNDVVAQYKGTHAIMSLHERALNVLACKYVDEVVIGAPFTITRDLVKTLNVTTVARVEPSAKSLARVSHRVPDPCAEVDSLGLVKTLTPTPPALNTDEVVQRILEHRALYEKRNASRAHKDAAYAESKKYVEEK